MKNEFSTLGPMPVDPSRKAARHAKKTAALAASTG